MDGVKYAIVRGVNEKGQRYLDQYDLETKTHEKRPLQGGSDALVAMSDAGLMAITSSGKMQVFNMAERKVVSSGALAAHSATGESNSVQYWKFVTPNIVALVSADKNVYTWSLSESNAAPTQLFKLQDGLHSGTVHDIQMSDDAQWFAVVVHVPLGNGEVKPQVQMMSVARGVSSVQEASAAAVYTHPSRGCTVMALTSKGPSGAFRLMVAELASAPGAQKFERLVLELPVDSGNSLPVCLLRQGLDPSLLTVVTKNGSVHVANTESRAWVAHSKLGDGSEEFFAGAYSPGFNHLVVLSHQGSVYAVTTRGGSTPAAASSSSAAVTPAPVSHSPAPSASTASSASVSPAPTAQTPPVTQTPPPTAQPTNDSFQGLSLQSMVEPRKPLTPLEEYFSVYPPEALQLYKNERAKFLPYVRENNITLNWQGLLAADRDMSVASKLAFGHALAHLQLASRGAIVSHFETMGYLADSHAKANYMIDLLGTNNVPADADLQTSAIVQGLKTNPKSVVDAVVRKQWTFFDPTIVSTAALEAEQWDLVWLLATSFEQRINLISQHSMSVSANQLLQWFNSLPADGGLQVLETLHSANALQALSWERIAAPPNDRLAPHIDLTISPPFQTLRVKIASTNDPALWKRYIDIAVKFGESKEISRILLQYSHDKSINDLTEEAVQRAAASSSLDAALPLLILAERTGKLEGLVAYHISRPTATNFLISYITTIQPQNAARVIALVAERSDASELLEELILAAAKVEALSTPNLWLASNQNGTQATIASAVGKLNTSNGDIPLINAFHAKFHTLA